MGISRKKDARENNPVYSITEGFCFKKMSNLRPIINSNVAGFVTLLPFKGTNPWF